MQPSRPRGRNTVFRATGIPIDDEASTALSAFLLYEKDSVTSDLAVSLAPNLAQGTGSDRAERFLRTALRIKLRHGGELEFPHQGICIEPLPCCYNIAKWSALLFFEQDNLPQFLVSAAGKPTHITIGGITINIDRDYYGFTQMYQTEGRIKADIIALSGLDGHAYGSFRHKKTGHMWLRDFFSHDFPQYRTMVYGYNAKLKEYNVDTIMDYSLKFLGDIKLVRQTDEEKRRPLILMGHSFGGLVITQSLVKAAEMPDDPLLRATCLILFFGVPHKGLPVADIRKMIPADHPRQALLSQIDCNSPELANILSWFKITTGERKVISFYERQQTRELKEDLESRKFSRCGDIRYTAVDKDSALLQLPDDIEVKIPVNEDHSAIVKFDSIQHDVYRHVRQHVKSLGDGDFRCIEDRFSNSHYLTTSKCMKELRKMASNCLEDVLETKQKQRYPDTCEWILNSPRYLKWENASESDFLLISGPPGYGKTTLCSFLQGLRKDKALKIYFFYDDKSDSRKNELHLFRTALYQLTHEVAPGPIQTRTVNMVSASRRELKAKSRPLELYGSSDRMWDILQQMIRDGIPGVDEIWWVIDALDECELNSRESLLERLRGFFPSRNTQKLRLKIVASCREYEEILCLAPPTEGIRLDVITDIKHDVDRYIEAVCIQFKESFGLTNKYYLSLSSGMKALAGGLFLGARLSLDVVQKRLFSMRNTPKPWVFSSDIIPASTKIKGIEGLLKTIISELGNLELKALQYSSLSKRPLTKEELNGLLNYDTTNDADAECYLDCSPLARFKDDNCLHLYHQSVKDYILTQITPEIENHFAEILISCLLVSSGDSKIRPYATEYWFQHIPETILDSLCRSLQTIYRPQNFSRWNREYLSLLDGRGRFFRRWKAGRINTPLHCAIIYGHATLVKQLVDPDQSQTEARQLIQNPSDVGVDSWNDHGETPLSLASTCRIEEPKIMRLLLDSPLHSNVNKQDRGSYHALFSGNTWMSRCAISLLLGNPKINVNMRNNNGKTPLIKAISIQDPAASYFIRRLLEDPRVDVNILDSRGCSAAYYAINNGDFDTINLLCMRSELLKRPKPELFQDCPENPENQQPPVNADFNWTEIPGGRSALHDASRAGYDTIVQLLLKQPNIDINARDHDGHTPLSFLIPLNRQASRNRPTLRKLQEVVNILISDPRINVNMENYNGETALILAAAGGHHEIVEPLLQYPSIAVETKDNNGSTPLCLAAKNGNFDVVKLLLKHPGVDINVKDNYGDTPLTLASLTGFSDVVEVLLNHPGVDTNLKNENGESPLALASQTGSSDLVEMVLNHPGVDINVEDKYGDTPLALASRTGSSNVVKILLNHPGVDINVKNNYGDTPLTLTSRTGSSNVVEVLLKHPRVDINVKNKNGESPLALAIQERQFDVIKLLAKHPRVDINAKIKGGDTPLAAAIRWQQFNVVKVLLKHPGVDINVKGEHGDTPLALASRRGSSNVVEMLLKHPRVDINVKNKNGKSPLALAIQERRFNVIKLLAKHPRVDINAKIKGGDTPLATAIRWQQFNVVKVLLKHPGVDINVKDKYGDTPLAAAIRWQQPNVVELLVKHPTVDITVKDSYGDTPLALASRRGSSVVVELLLKHPRVDINVKDNYGDTPLAIAIRERQFNVIELLATHPRVEASIKNNDGDSPLALAAWGGLSDVVELLLKHPRVDINVKNENGETPLALAARGGLSDMVELLLKHSRVDINAKNNNGDTPLAVASLNGYDDVVRLLLEHPKVDINSQNQHGQTPLDILTSSGAFNVELQQLISSRGLELRNFLQLPMMGPGTAPPSVIHRHQHPYLHSNGHCPRILTASQTAVNSISSEGYEAMEEYARAQGITREVCLAQSTP